MLGTNSIEQIAFVVEDINQAIESFSKLLGVVQPEWFLTGPHDESQVFYRGKPSDTQSKLVFIDTPSVQIELMEVNEAPSTMKAYLDENGEGIHHLAFVVDKISKRIKPLEESGIHVLQSGEFTSTNRGRYAYLDTESTLKTVFELLERESPQPKKIGELVKEPLFSSRKITQIAFVVENLDESAVCFGRLLNMDIPSKVHSGAKPVTKTIYLGEETDVDATFMFFKTPTIEIELIQPSERVSAWKDHLEQYGEGIHHLALEVKGLRNLLPQLAQQGYRVIQQGMFWNGNGEYAYLDTKEEFKVIIELFERYNT